MADGLTIITIALGGLAFMLALASYFGTFYPISWPMLIVCFQLPALLHLGVFFVGWWRIYAPDTDPELLKQFTQWLILAMLFSFFPPAFIINIYLAQADIRKVIQQGRTTRRRRSSRAKKS